MASRRWGLRVGLGCRWGLSTPTGGVPCALRAAPVLTLFLLGLEFSVSDTGAHEVGPLWEEPQLRV